MLKKRMRGIHICQKIESSALRSAGSGAFIDVKRSGNCTQTSDISQESGECVKGERAL